MKTFINSIILIVLATVSLGIGAAGYSFQSQKNFSLENIIPKISLPTLSLPKFAAKQVPTYTPTPTNKPIATITPTQKPTNTPTPKPTLIPTPSLFPLPTYAVNQIPESWKEYASAEAKFSLKYPDYWNIKPLPKQTSADNVITSQQFLFDYQPGRPNGATVALDSKTENNYEAYDLDKYILETKKPYSQIKKASVNGIDVAEVHNFACPSNNDCISLIFKHNATFYEMYSSIDSEKYTNLPILYQMISSVKFIDNPTNK